MHTTQIAANMRITASIIAMSMNAASTRMNTRMIMGTGMTHAAVSTNMTRIAAVTSTLTIILTAMSAVAGMNILTAMPAVADMNTADTAMAKSTQC